MSDRYFISHVAHGGDPTGYGMDYPGPNSKMYHEHTGHRPGRDPVEVGGGVDRHPSMSKPLYLQRLPWVQGQNRDGSGYNGVESCSRDCQHIPVPLFLVFLNPRKAYDTMDLERLLITLEEYGVGPRLCGLLETFWDRQ